MFSKKSVELPSSLAADPEKSKIMASRNSGSSTFSVLGTDITVTGDIKASADLHVDGSVEGDIACSSLVQGESSVIEGGVEAESARLAGKVTGTISVRELTILKTARIEGDVHYDALTIEQGAQVQGRFSPRAAATSAGRQQAVESKGSADVPNTGHIAAVS